MKVVLVSCFDYYEQRMKGLIEYFKSRGHDVEYLITDYNHFSKSVYKVDYKCSKQIHVIPYSKNISPQRLISHYMFSKRVVSEIRKIKPDVIYCVIPPNSLVKHLGLYKRRNKNVKLAFDIYDSWPESFPNKNPNVIMRKAFKIWASLRDNYIKDADLLISVSKSSKEDLEAKYKKETSVLMPTISVGEIPNYHFNVKDRISFCYLGHVNYITDVDLGTKILSGVAKEKRVELHIIGEGQNKEQWVKTLTENGINVICHGVVFDTNKKNEIFEQCDMGLNIPRPEIQSTMALKSVEYMKVGLPFVNSGLGDNEELVRSCNIGVNVKDGDIVRRLASLSQDELTLMHNNSIQCYQERFVCQDYDGILSRLL